MTTEQSQSKVPIRFRRHLFNAIAPILGNALYKYPDTIIVNPAPLSQSTYIRRFREANEAKRLYHYLHSSINESQYALNANDLSIADHDNGMVIIGPRNTIIERRKKEVGAIIENVPKTQQLIEVPFLYLMDFAKLLPLLSPRPSNFFVTVANPSFLTPYESGYDIGFVPDATTPNRFFII